MKRIDYYFMQNKICQHPISIAAEPSKQSEVLTDACVTTSRADLLQNILLCYIRSHLYACKRSSHLPISCVCVTLVSEVSILMEAAITVRMSVRPPAKFTEKTDWSLWISRFERYVKEAKVPDSERVKELLPLLEDEPLRLVVQYGLSESVHGLCRGTRVSLWPRRQRTGMAGKVSGSSTTAGRVPSRIHW